MKTFSNWMETAVPPHDGADPVDWQAWYVGMEPLILQSSLEELEKTGDLSIAAMSKRAGVSEGYAAFLRREFLKRHRQSTHDAAFERQRKEKEAAAWAERRDDYLYHVTTKRRLPLIKKNGLSPNAPSQFSNYTDNSKGKVFFCEKEGVQFWKFQVENHEHHNHDNPSRVIVLRVLRSTLEDEIQNDGIGTDDSGSPSYFVTRRVPANVIEVVQAS